MNPKLTQLLCSQLFSQLRQSNQEMAHLSDDEISVELLTHRITELETALDAAYKLVAALSDSVKYAEDDRARHQISGEEVHDFLLQNLSELGKLRQELIINSLKDILVGDGIKAFPKTSVEMACLIFRLLTIQE